MGHCPVCMVNKGVSGEQGRADAVDGLVERLMKEADFDPVMKPVARMVLEAGSLEELRDNLLDAYQGMDETELGNLLQRAFTVAELTGRFEAKEGNGEAGQTP